MNNTILSKDIQIVQFRNQELITFEQNGKRYTAMKPICENIGLAWESQLARIKRDEVLSEGMIVMITPTNGGNQQMVCLPIEYINGWLFGIDIKRCKPEIRERLVMYKKECYRVLYNYWNDQSQQLTLPEPDPTVSIELTVNEWRNLVNVWALFTRYEDSVSFLLKSVAPFIHGHPFSSAQFNHSRAKPALIETVPTIKKILEKLPKAVKFHESREQISHKYGF